MLDCGKDDLLVWCDRGGVEGLEEDLIERGNVDTIERQRLFDNG